MAYYEDLTDEELSKALNNLTKTYYGCHGHNKAARNKAKMEHVIELMKGRELPIPTVDSRLQFGIFNGKHTD